MTTPAPLAAPEPLEAFRARVDAFAREVLAPAAHAWEAAGEAPRDLFREAGRRGFLGLRVEPAHGGAGLPYPYTQAYLEALGRSGAWGAVLGLVIQSEMATPVLERFGSEAQKRRWLAPAVRGDLVAAIAMTEPEGGSDLAGLRTTATPVPGGFRLEGRKFMVGNGSRADVVVVVAALGRRRTRLPRLAALLVPRKTPGFRVVRRLEKIGLCATDNAELAFENCFVPDAQVIGRPGRAGSYLTHSNAFERLALAVVSLGAMDALFEHARAFAASRQVAGAPLLAHPLWRHRLARAALRIEASRRLVAGAAESMDRERPDLRLVTMAKIEATECLQRVARTTSQALGARGFLRDDLAGRAHADARALTIGGGTSEVLTEMLANLVL